LKITIFGTGYVGLVTGACLAEAGHEVTCVDVDLNKINGLNDGIIPIYEPGLEPIVRKNYQAGRLKFTNNAEEGVKFGLLQFIAVGTPPDEDGSADLQYVLQVARTIADYMDGPKIIIDKSTVPVGTAEKVSAVVAGVLEKRRCVIQYEVCSNPEFLKEGSAIEDFTNGARIIVGTESDWVKEQLMECYHPYSHNHEKMMFMDVRSAELTKYAANAMLATKISFINELSNIAELLGADIENVRKGIGSDPRIGYHFIYPGCGYGGACFPKDVQALVKAAAEYKYDAELIKAVESVNLRQKSCLFDKLHSALDGDLKGRIIAVWGLSFKPNTDDMREAPSQTLMEAIWNAGGKVRAFDPESMKETHRIYGDRKDLILVSKRDDAIMGADALVVCTEWDTFRTVDFCLIKKELKEPVIIDGRNLYNPVTLKDMGFKYYGIGRGESIKFQG
jgi:UDPglucose 6-dehydrogenase